MRTFYIWEPDPNGHRMVYANLILERALELGASAKIIMPSQSVSNPQVKMHVGRQDLIANCADLRHARQISAHEDARLIIPSGDHNLTQLARPRAGERVTVLVMDDPAWYPPAPRKRAKAALIRVLRTRRQIRVLRLSPNAPIRALPSDRAPDPVLITNYRGYASDASELRAHLQMSPDIRWIGVVGGLSINKNPLLVAMAAASASEKNGNVGLALLGPVPPESRDLLKEIKELAVRAGLPLVLDNRRLSNDEMNTAVAAVDAVVCAYSTSAPNSTTAKAFYLGTRVVGAGPEAFLRNGCRFWTSTAAGMSAHAVQMALEEALGMPTPEPQNAPDPREFADRLLGFA
ncbi:glycosyltransferase family protein [Flexivirga lutea]